ncbi:MAG: DegV family protein [Clostridium sp.]|uniref:DegV domain-containing protein n=1 Tax=Clostridium paraputrificum TaxID=29363 RepID=A0A6N3AD55_9CLOT|nr:DegV family protein [Clostridium sp.]MBS5925454.1 DegV family protein [Clostridium sp.]
MQKIALVTDSSCDLGEKTRRDNNIEMLPFRIIYKDKEFLDQVNITHDELYKSLSEEIPTTSLPDLEYTENLVCRLKEEGYTDVIVITVSSRLSGTLNSIKLLVEDHKELNFHFYDSKTLGFPVGALVLEASLMIRAGLTPEEIIDKLHEVKTKLHAYVTLNTLEFLRKGGRIGRVAGAVGEILHLKPIISANEEGELYPWGKCRGRKQAISKLRSIIHERLENSRCKVWILSGASHDEAVALYESVKSHTNISHISLEMIGATMGVHTGPGALGVCILEE